MAKSVNDLINVELPRWQWQAIAGQLRQTVDVRDTTPQESDMEQLITDGLNEAERVISSILENQ